MSLLAVIFWKEEFLKMYSKNTKDYNYLVINNISVKVDDLNSIYGVFKAENI